MHHPLCVLPYNCSTRFRLITSDHLNLDGKGICVLTNETAQFLFLAVWDILVSIRGRDKNVTLHFQQKCYISQNVIVSIKSRKYLRFVHLFSQPLINCPRKLDYNGDMHHFHQKHKHKRLHKLRGNNYVCLHRLLEVHSCQIKIFSC